jgi:hypothetical protein
MSKRRISSRTSEILRFAQNDNESYSDSDNHNDDHSDSDNDYNHVDDHVEPTGIATTLKKTSKKPHDIVRGPLDERTCLPERGN